jgi:predicted RNA polymerase sigma factor
VNADVTTRATADATGDATADAISDSVARRSYGKLVAILAARTRDVAAAEDALSDAFASALATWPAHGCPSNPEAWLLTAARRKVVDAARRRHTSDAAAEQGRLDTEAWSDVPEAEIPDRRLAMMFACAHPAIDASIRAPLILQTMLGLDASRIASAFLTSPTAMGKRLVRAKEKIRLAGIAFRIPEREELPGRVDAILDAIYAAFTDGWSDATGSDALRTDLADEAIYLARVVTELLPGDAESRGLLALMLYAHSRRRARRSPAGEYVPLVEQNTAVWDSGAIDEAETLLRRATAMGRIGRYQLEAALQSAHTERCRTGRDNWAEVVQLYDALSAIAPSPVVAINRAVAIGETSGPNAALEAMPRIGDDGRLADYQPYWAAQAMLLGRAGQVVDARRAYDLAIGLERDPAVRNYLQRQQRALGDISGI